MPQELSTHTSIVVLNYNGTQNTIMCVNSLLQLNTQNTRINIIIVDNLSQDEEVKNLSEFYNSTKLTNDNITLILNDNNAGFAGGMNIGVKHGITNYDSDFYWLINNDLTVDKNSLNSLINFYNQNTDINVGIIGSKIMNFSDNLENNTIQSVGAELLKNTGNLRTVDVTEVNTIKDQKLMNQRLFSVPGCAFFITKELINKIGLLEDKYFLYFEEFDYSLRAIQAGFYTLSCFESILYHKSGASTGEGNRITFYYMTRSRIAFYKKFLPFNLLTVLPFQIYQVCLKPLIKLKFQILSWTSKGIIDGLLIK